MWSLNPCDIQYVSYSLSPQDNLCIIVVGEHHQEKITTMLFSVLLALCLSGFAVSSQINEIQTAGKRANVIQHKSGNLS